MGKGDSKLPDGQTFDQIKSVRQTVGGHKKNIPINSLNQSDQSDGATAISNEKPIRLVELTILIWLDASSDKHNESTIKTLTNLSRVTNLIETFTDLEACYQFMTTIKKEKILFVVSGSFGPQIVPRIENFEQIHSIYLFCGNKANHIEWTKPYKKIKGIHTQIKDLCDSLRFDNNEFDKSITSISILPPSTSTDLTQENKQFIYLQVMKSILIEIQYEKKFRRELMDYARPFYAKHGQQSSIINTLDENYSIHSPIWWYTRKCFIYRMLRKAFRDQDFELIYKLAFFIRDLHRDIKKAYMQTHNHQYHPISVYRAASMSIKEYENFEKNREGLLSFDDFLITTLERTIALKFATKLRGDPNSVAIIYKIDIDPAKSSIPFIALNNLSYLSSANGEILLSMNTIFRIDQIERVVDRLYEITLSPASKKDEQIQNLVQCMQEITHGLTGWFKLSKILMEVNEYNQAESIHKYMYDQTNDNQREERAFLLHELGYINDMKNNLPTSIAYYQQSIEMYLRYLQPNHPTLYSTYSNLGSVLERHGDLQAAINTYQNALKLAPSDDPENLITQYRNIASALLKQQKFTEAQQTYDAALQILLKDFPSAHPLIASTYSSLGRLFYIKKDYSKALGYFQQTHEIEDKFLLANHPAFVTTYFNIATTHEALNDYKRALKYAEKAVEKGRRACGDDHIEVKEARQYLEQLQRKVQNVQL